MANLFRIAVAATMASVVFCCTRQANCDIVTPVTGWAVHNGTSSVADGGTNSPTFATADNISVMGAFSDGSGTAVARASFDLNGLTLDRAGDTGGGSTIDSPTCIHVDAGQYVVFAKSLDSAANGGITGAVASFSFAMIPGSTTGPGDVQILAGTTVIDVISPVRTASLPASIGKTLYLPRPLSSARTCSVTRRSMSNTGVPLVNGGTPMFLMYSGRNEPRPASE